VEAAGGEAWDVRHEAGGDEGAQQHGAQQQGGCDALQVRVRVGLGGHLRAGIGAPAAGGKRGLVRVLRGAERRELVSAAVKVKRAARHPEVSRAMRELAACGKVVGSRSAKISVRVDPAVFAAAAARFGLAGSRVCDVVNAALAAAGAPATFKQWLRDGADRIPDNFELAI
jgi:hypothetical protein